jgi:class 3 adenylate cyclase/tetratricopeptide (TPR) repeat protein
MRCSNCGSENPAGKRFCGDCGTPLEGRAPMPAPEPRGPLPGERRHLTVLFCDLVGSTEIAARLDPEEWREIVASYHRAATEAITRFGGYVAQYLGDGVMAYFGWPEAHDNNAERAAHAGLAIIDVISKLNEQSTRPKLSARIGIDSGAVVVGAGTSTSADVFGDTPNIAARVQAAALPNTVLITADTYRLLSGLFVVEDYGAQALKGIDRLTRLYRAIQPSGVHGRLEAAASRGLTPFVGREQELRLLMNLWERVREGEGQVVTIIGEPGIGKSRLVRRFHEQIEGEHIWLEAAARSFFQNSPFYQVGDLIKQFLRFEENNPPEVNLARLERALAASGLMLAEAIPLIAPLLNLAIPPKYPPLTISSEQQRRRLLSTLVDWVIGGVRLLQSPHAIVTEDLQWADPSTLELFSLLVQQGGKSRLLLLFTARPEFGASWPLLAHHTQIAIGGLSALNARSMIEDIGAHDALSHETIETVIERTGGVPLFIEELTRALLESGSALLNMRDVPVTLHDSLTARLDRLGAAKEIAQVGAVIGSEFPYTLLQAVHPVTEAELQRGLHALVDADLLYVRGIAPEATYQFKHALICDAAYEALLKSKRRELHTRIARTLEETYPEQGTSRPEILAYHYSEAGLIAQAIRYWRIAGRSANERSAYSEAISHFNRGLELIARLPETPQLISEELRLQIALTEPLTAIKGYTAPEVEKACNRAWQLCQQVGKGPQLFAVLARLYSVSANRRELQKSLDLAREMLRLAEGGQDKMSLLWAHYCLGHTLSMRGELAAARAHTEQSMALYDFDHSREYGYVQDPGATGLARLAHLLFLLGYPDQARAKSLKALAHARKLSHPFTLGWVLNSVAAIHARCGEFEKAETLWTEQVGLCTQQNFSSLVGPGIAGLAMVMAEQGRRQEAISRMREGREAFPGAEAQQEQTSYLIRLAYAYKSVRLWKEGLAVVAEALKLVSETSTYEAATLYHLKGEMLLMEDAANGSEPQRCFCAAIELARTVGAKSIELQTTTSLARVLARQGRRDEARTILAAIYNWFTEGFDLPDLKDAKMLLDELNS